MRKGGGGGDGGEYDAPTNANDSRCVTDSSSPGARCFST